MDNNFPQISQEQLRQLAASPAAQRLMTMLQQEHTAAMDSAISGAKSGDMAAVQRSLSAFLSDPKAKELIRKLQEEQHG